MNGESALTAFQAEVVRAFFELPASEGFLLAGGAALLAQNLTTRPTQDLDFFTRPGGGRGRPSGSGIRRARSVSRVDSGHDSGQ